MAWRSFFAVQQQFFWGAINKTEVQKIDIKIEVEVSSWLWLDQRPYFCPNQDPEAVFLDFDLSRLSQFVFFVSGYFSAQQTAFRRSGSWNMTLYCNSLIRTDVMYYRHKREVENRYLLTFDFREAIFTALFYEDLYCIFEKSSVFSSFQSKRGRLNSIKYFSVKIPGLKLTKVLQNKYPVGQ